MSDSSSDLATLKTQVDNLKRRISQIEGSMMSKVTKTNIFDSKDPNFKSTVKTTGIPIILNDNGNSTYLGSSSGNLTENSSQNCAVGNSSLCFNRTGNNNTAFGYFSLRSSQTSDNTGFGSHTLVSNNSGTNNTAIGSHSSFLNDSGSNNTSVGYYSLSNNTEGNNNTSFGYNSLTNNVTGSGNTCFGANTNVVSSDIENSTAIGFGATSNQSNQIVLGNDSISTLKCNTSLSVTSDERYKTEITEDVPGIEFITRLRPVTYNLIRCMGVKRTGLIAQEVEKAASEIGYDFDGVLKPLNDNDHYSLSYATFVVPLIKTVKEQQIMIECLFRQIAELQSEI